MLKNDARVSLAELPEAGIHLRPVDAVTIVREIALQVARGELPGVPSPQVIRLSSTGAISVEGPVPADGRSVPRAAQLLESLLPGFDAPAGYRVTGALRLVIARAKRAIDLPAYVSLDSFADALARFSAPDPEAAIRELVACWSETCASPRPPEPAHPAPPAAFSQPAETNGSSTTPSQSAALVPAGPAALTVSDIRRARRATGLPLTEISARSRIPLPMLRQLEWGYLRNWPTGHYGRTQLVRYARAAGLDEQLVVSTVWPMVGEQALHAPRAASLARVPTERPLVDRPPLVEIEDATIVVDDLPLTRVDVPSDVQSVTVAHRKPTWVLAALAIPALIALALWPAVSVRLANWSPPESLAFLRSLPGSPVKPETEQARLDTSATSQSDGVAVHAPDAGIRESPAEGSTGTASAPATPRPVGSAGASADPATRPRGEEAPTTDEGAYSPAFATVGSAVFYRPEGGDDRGGLVPADASAGGTVLRITRVVDDGARNFHARPSPDGMRVAFDSDRDGVRAVYVADSNGENVRRVSGDGFAAVPSWSPDGRTLAFVRAEPDKPRVWNIWTADLQSGELHRVTDHSEGQPWGASWFPDGGRIAYSLEDRLIVRDLATGRERRYSSPRKGRLVRTPAVSPDGRRVMFQVYRDGAWLLDLGDGSMQKVLADPTAEEYAWSPDGRRVAYHSRRSDQWGVWVMAAR